MARAADRSTVYKGGSSTVLALFSEATRRGLSYAKIGAIAGVGPSTVSSWWRGDREPGIVNVEKWAKGMGGFLVFSLPAEVGAPRQEREVRFRSQSDPWSRESKKLIGYAGRER